MRLVGLVHAAGPLERLIGKAGKYKGKVREGPNRNAAFMRPIGEIPLCVGTEHAGDARCSVPTSSTVRFDQLLRASLQAVA